MRKFKTYIMTVVMALTLGAPLLVPAVATAACSSGNSSRDQVLNGAGSTGSDCTGNGFTDAITAAVKIISLIAGVVAVIMVVLAGFRYITSAGASDKVAAAKSSLIYALIGVAVVALSQFLIHFVLTQSKQATLPTCGAHQSPAHDNCAAR